MTASLVAGWLLAYTTHSVVWSAIAFCAGAALSARPAARHRLWRVALFGPLVTATFAIAVYRPNAGTRSVSLTTALRPYLPAYWRERRVESRLEMRIGAAPVTSLDVTDPLERAASLLVCGIFGGPAMIVGLVLLRRRKRAFQQLRVRLAPTDDASRSRLARERGVTLYRSSILEVPLALMGKRICLPEQAFAELDPAEQESVLLHELAHVERHDPAWAEVARFVVAVGWWQPLNRFLLRRLERDAELAADMRAVERGAGPAALVAALAAFATRVESAGPVPGVPLARVDSPLVERARRLLEGPPRRRTARVVAVSALAALLFIGSAVLLPIPTTAGEVRPSRQRGEDGLRGVSVDDRDVDVIQIVPAR